MNRYMGGAAYPGDLRDALRSLQRSVDDLRISAECALLSARAKRNGLPARHTVPGMVYLDLGTEAHIYQARLPLAGLWIVIKLYKHGESDLPRARFHAAEIRDIAERLVDVMPRVYHVDVIRSRVVVFMEKLRGIPLYGLAIRPSLHGMLSSELFRVLDDLHDTYPWGHGDLNPKNIFVSFERDRRPGAGGHVPAGEAPIAMRVRLLDFSVTRARKIAGRRGKTDDLITILWYMLNLRGRFSGTALVDAIVFHRVRARCLIAAERLRPRLRRFLETATSPRAFFPLTEQERTALDAEMLQSFGFDPQ